MIAYLCDSCGKQLEGNNGEAVNLDIETAAHVPYQVKLSIGLDHYHKECVIEDIRRFFTEHLKFKVEQLRVSQGSTSPLEEGACISVLEDMSAVALPLGNWNTDKGVKINLIKYFKNGDYYLGLDGGGSEWKFDKHGRCEDERIGQLSKQRRGEEAW